MDETGIMDGQDRPYKVIGMAETNVSIVKTQNRSDWRSILECYNAEGNCLPPAVIFQGKSP